MSNRLYFICPTDHLEMVIKQNFKQEHYFYTSLGNSVVLDSETVEQINGLIESENIKEIAFLLSRDNDIIKGVLENHKYNDIKGMSNFYGVIHNHLGDLNLNKRIEDIELQLIPSYLNEKIKELRLVISKWLIESITINALIYNRQHNVFIEVDSKLFDLDDFFLN
jgi:hypothetical protein